MQSGGEGGQSLLADGLAISQALQQNYPEAYKILTTVPVDWSDIVEESGRHFHSLYRAPVIWYEQTVVSDSTYQCSTT